MTKRVAGSVAGLTMGNAARRDGSDETAVGGGARKRGVVGIWWKRTPTAK